MLFRYSNHMFDQETGERLIEQVHYVASSSSPDGMMGMDGRGGQGGREMMVGNGNGSSSSHRTNHNPPVLSYERALMKGQGIAQGQGLGPTPGLGLASGSSTQQEKENHRIAKLLLKKQTKLKEKKEKMAVVKQKKKEVWPYSHLCRPSNMYIVSLN